jgi:hypothetical protein
LSTEVFGPLGIGITIGELADLIDDSGIGAPDLVGPGGTGHLPTGAGLGLPADSDTDRLRVLGQGDVLDQTAQQLLALGRRGGLGPPEGREILGERQEAFALLGTDRRVASSGRAVYARSRRSKAASFSFHSRSRLRTTRRCSGSTARQRRRARAAS